MPGRVETLGRTEAIPMPKSGLERRGKQTPQRDQPRSRL